MILLSVVWYFEATGVKDERKKVGELRRVKRTENVSRKRLRDLGQILAS